MGRLLQDLRYGVRSLAGSPLVTVAALVSLALGIGAVAAIFGAIDVFMLRPLDYEDADELVAVWTTDEQRGWATSATSVPDFLDWRRESRTLEMAAYAGVGLNLSGTDQPERLIGYQVSAGFFDLLGERPLLGRTFRPDEEEPGAPRVAVLAEGVWRRSFGGDPAVVGRTLRLNGEAYEVVGVMPQDFTFGGGDQDVWIPLTFTGDEPRGSRFLRVVGRLADGSTAASAKRELDVVQAGLASTFPDTNGGKGAAVIPLRDEWYDEGFRQGSLIAGTAVIFVLFIACANVANLLLARGAARGREIALRAALGAGRKRIVAQLLTESLLLAFAGGALGVGVAWIGMEGIRSLLPPFVPGLDDIALNARTLAVTGAAALASALVFGLAPTLQVSRPDLRGALAEGGGGGTSVRGGRTRKALVAAEIALSVVLLVSAVLLVKGYAGVRSNELGYRIEELVTMRLFLPQAKYPDDEAIVVFDRALLERVRGLPGIVSAGAASLLPMQGAWSTSYLVAGEEAPADGRAPGVSYRVVTPGYAETMGMSLVAGRLFTEDDVAAAPRVVLVNEPFADLHWAGESPLGRRVRMWEQEWEIVGVVGRTRDWGPDSDPGRMLYVPLWQMPIRSLTLVAHTGVDPSTLLASVRDEVRALDPDQPVYAASTMEEIAKQNLAGNMAMIKVLGVLSIVAFVLSAVGVYGVMAYSVAQRTREMGVRVALGAQARDVRNLVVRQGLVVAASGIVVGLAVALATTRMLGFFLFGLSPRDPAPYAIVTGLLLLTALAASWIPAVRATRVDPVEVLSS